MVSAEFFFQPGKAGSVCFVDCSGWVVQAVAQYIRILQDLVQERMLHILVAMVSNRIANSNDLLLGELT